ncbi:hypothetical protein BCR42DRAFT_116901 [Absidia repens]|uniref:Thioredoxin-like protein n=1 Tax=Absidia repens TaxID=90262 RepID=A0A1X2I5K7_9FUNG|nr:hypothetical protein BCR42DRAFT_116901 [Absidia repens]
MSFRPPKTLPILSIFHNSRVPLSRQAVAMLQERRSRPNTGEDVYRVDIIGDDTLPTKDQLEQMASYLHGWDHLVSAAQDQNENTSQQQHPSPTTLQDAETLLLKDPSALQRPVVVDWSNGMAAVGTSSLDTIEALVQHRLNSKKGGLF